MTFIGGTYLNKELQEYSTKPESSKNQTTTSATNNANVVTAPVTTPVTKTEKPKSSEVKAEPKIKARRFNSEDVYEKYKKNPTSAISHIGYNFNDKQKKELEKLVANEEDLKVFLSIADKEHLTAEDAIQTYKAVKAQEKPTGFWGKLKNGVVTIFTGKTYHERKGEETSTNVAEIREVRGEEFSTETVVKLGVQITNDGKKEEVMHFVEVKSPKGTFRYSETNVTDAAEFIAENPDEADTFVKNARELEEITNEKGEPKYTSDVIIKVDKRMVKNPELAPTMKTAAHKTDMTGEYLDTITANLEANPEMQESLDYSLTAQDSKGQDRFTAKSVCTQSNQLVDKDGNYCDNYTENLKNIAQYENISAEDAVTITDNITAHPETAADVIAKIESGNYTSSEIVEYSNNCAESAENGTYVPEYSGTQCTDSLPQSVTNESNQTFTENESDDTKTQTSENNGKKYTVKTHTNPMVSKFADNSDKELETSKEKLPSSETIQINGKTYPKSEIKKVIEKEFGYCISEKVLREIEKDPKFIDELKRWGTDSVVTEVLLENPHLIGQIKNLCGTLSKSELKDVLMLCTNKDKTQMVLAALANGTVDDAKKIVTKAENCNAGADVMNILLNSSLSSLEKLRKIDELLSNRNKNERFEQIC